MIKKTEMFLRIDKKEKNRIAAIDDNGSSISYGELSDFSPLFTKTIPKRSIVFLMCKNNIGCLYAYVSMIENGIVPVTLSENIDKELFNNLLESYQPQFICVDQSHVKDYFLKIVYREKGYVYLYTGYAQYPINDKLELLMTTSGSTGSPKLVRYKQGNLTANAANVAKAWGWTQDERPICDLSMNYTMGLNVINTHLFAGAKLLLVSSNITNVKYWNFIKENTATNFTGVPFSFDLLWKLRFFRMNLPHLTTLSAGGGKLTDVMFKTIAEYARDNGKRFIASFGTTETSARIAMLEPNLALERIGSIGKAIPEGELFLLDHDGNIIEKVEAEGELGYRGPNVTMGYAFSKDDLMLGDTFEGLYLTGDMARRDKDGFYYIVGRKSRFLKMLGYRVSLDQCENLIRTRFNIDCACSGSDDQMKIFITDESFIDSIREFISEKTGIYVSMFQVVKVESIPRNNEGKILYSSIC